MLRVNSNAIERIHFANEEKTITMRAQFGFDCVWCV